MPANHKAHEYIPIEKQPIYESLITQQEDAEKSLILEATYAAPSATETFVDFYTHLTSAYNCSCLVVELITRPGRMSNF